MKKIFVAAVMAAIALLAGCASLPPVVVPPPATEEVAMAEGSEGILVLTRNQGVGERVWFCPQDVATPAQFAAGRGGVPTALFTPDGKLCRQGEAVEYRGIALGEKVDFLLLCRGRIPWSCHFPKGALNGMDAVFLRGGIPPMDPEVLEGIGYAFDGAPRQDLPPCQ